MVMESILAKMERALKTMIPAMVAHSGVDNLYFGG